MNTWIIGGKRYNEEEYEEYKQQELKRWAADEAEVQRLVGAVAESLRACDKFMEEHPRYPYGLKDDAQQREFKIYEKLRHNLLRADNSPRCEKVREDGTVCGCPQMKGYRYCYAHERMLQMQSQKLELPSVEDANGIQMAIMRVQKALIDDEISEKKAGLLLYSLQMASCNLKHTSFAKTGEKATVEMPEPPRAGTSRVKETQHLTTEARRRGENLLPQISADGRRSGRAGAVGKGKGKCIDPSAALGMTSSGRQSAEGFNSETHAKLG